MAASTRLSSTEQWFGRTALIGEQALRQHSGDRVGAAADLGAEAHPVVAGETARGHIGTHPSILPDTPESAPRNGHGGVERGS
jgi:hypothetical protein